MKRRTMTLFCILCTALLSAGCQETAAPGETESAKSALGELFGDELVTVTKSRVNVDDLADKKVAIYFSAHWCPPCKAFTPLLVKAYDELRAAGKPFEVVFVSSDRDEASMLGYMREAKMRWLAIPFGDQRAAALAKRFSVRGIPMLVVVDGTGRTLTTNARTDVMNKGSAAFDDW